MTEQELREKIVEVLTEAMKPIEYGGDSEHAPEFYYPTEEELAAALIEAGIGYVKEAERRAARAERALKSRAMCQVLKYFPNEISGLESCIQEVYEAWIYQAEKELAEEGKDD